MALSPRLILVARRSGCAAWQNFAGKIAEMDAALPAAAVSIAAARPAFLPLCCGGARRTFRRQEGIRRGICETEETTTAAEAAAL